MDSKNKRKKRYWIIIIVIALSLGAILFNIPSLSNWSPPESLQGTWVGKAQVSENIMMGSEANGKAGTVVPIKIQIDEDGIVTGYIGKAELTDCVVSSNRSWLGRWLGIKTDYVISKADLVGKITENDPQTQRIVSIPFDIVDGQLTGSIQRIEGLKYPDPLFVKINLGKE